MSTAGRRRRQSEVGRVLALASASVSEPRASSNRLLEMGKVQLARANETQVMGVTEADGFHPLHRQPGLCAHVPGHGATMTSSRNPDTCPCFPPWELPSPGAPAPLSTVDGQPL